MKQKINWPLFGAALSANLISLTAGGTYSWTSPVLPKLSSNNTDDNPFGRPITPLEESWIASLISLGACLGPFIGGAVVDRFGRKKTLLVLALPVIISHLILAFTSSLPLYYFSRFFAGLGVGCVFSLVPVYVGEIAEDSNRGALGCIMNTVCTSGTLFCLSVGPYLSIKVFCLCFVVPPVIFLLVFGLFFPESPYFWLMQNNEEEARKCLKRVRLGSVTKELEEMRYNVEKSMANKASFRDMLKSKALMRGFLVGSGLMFCAQFSGICAILSYLQSIFEASGNVIPPEICAMVIGALQVIINVVTSQLVDRVGRRILLLVSLMGTFLAHCLLGAFFYLKTNNYTEITSCLYWLPVCSLVLYIVMYQSGIGPLPWAMIGELFPPHAKSMASTCICFVCLISAFGLTVFFPNLSAAVGMAFSFWFFAVFCLLGFVFVYFVVPETKGKSLREIQDQLEGNKSLVK